MCRPTRLVKLALIPLSLSLFLFAHPAFAITPSLLIDGGSNTITSLNQTALSVTGNSGLDSIGGTFRSGTTTVTVTDSIGTMLTDQRIFADLDSKSFSFSFDTTTLVDGAVQVSLETVNTQGTVMASLSADVTKHTLAANPEFSLFLLSGATDSAECFSRSAELMSYSSTTLTNKPVCAFIATTTAEVFSPINTAGAHLFTSNDSFLFTFTDSFGNTGSASSTVSNIDTTLPEITITAPISGSTVGQALTPSVSATDANTVTLTCSLDGASMPDCISQLSGLTAGAHSYSVSATDTAGNIASSSALFSVSRGDPLLSLTASSSPVSIVLVDQSATTTVEVQSGSGTSSVEIPVGTNITKTDGSTLLPSDFSIADINGNTLSGIGSTVVVDGALQWGIAGQGIEFSQAITVNVFVGTSHNGETFTIYRSLNLTGGWTQDGLVSPTCLVVDGLCTFQTTKASYFASVHVPVPVPAPAPSGGGGGGGGGGGIIGGVPASGVGTVSAGVVNVVHVENSTPVETVADEGSVLGASTYNFARTLRLGSTGDDVKALQERLHDEGVYTGPVTSYFGILTETAVKVFQTNHGIEAVGIVGKLTRAELNKGLIQKTSTVVAVQKLTDAQVLAILSLLKSFGADASVIANVGASLGKQLP